MRLSLLSLPALALVAHASPVERVLSGRTSSDAPVPLSADERDELRQFARFTEVAYYTTDSIKTWSCGGQSRARGHRGHPSEVAARWQSTV